MKLHLPSTLRKAVLSCLAALASFLPSTLASGAAVAGGICSFALASSVALADDEDEDNPWLYGDVISGDYGISTYSSATWTDPLEGQWGEGIVDTAKGSVTLLEAGSQGTYGVYGDGKWSFEGGEGGNLKVVKRGSNVATNLSDANKQLKVSNLWLTYEGGDTPWGGNRMGNVYVVWHAGYLTSFIENIYVNYAGLRITAAQSDLRTNFILGKAHSVSGDLATNNTVLEVAAAVTTTGYLSIAEDTIVELRGGTLTVGHLEGGGDLTLHSSNTEGGTLVLTHGGANYNQLLSFAVGSSVYDSTVVLGADEGTEAVELKVSGLAGAHGAISAAEFASGGSGTLTITGASESNVASSISITGVNLALDAGASQSFTGLTFSGGRITLGEDSHLAVSGDSSLDLSNGGIELSGSSATLSIVVAEQSGESSLLTLSSEGLTSLLSSSGLQLALVGSFGAEEEISFQFLTLSDGTLSEDNRTALANLFSDKGGYGKRSVVSVSEDGTLTISVAADPLVWENGDGTWFNGTVDNSHWEDDAAFANNEKVQFGSGSGEVTIKDAVSVRSMTVAGGTWNFLSDVDTPGSLTVLGDLQVNAGSNVTIAADVATTLAGEIRVGDQASLNIENFILDASINRLTVSRLGESGKGTVTLTSALRVGVDVMVNEGAALILTLTSDLSADGGNDTISFSGNGDLTIKVTENRSIGARVVFNAACTRFELADGRTLTLGSDGLNNGIRGEGDILVHVDDGQAATLCLKGRHNGIAYTGVITLDGAVELNIYGLAVRMKGLVSGADSFTSLHGGDHTINLGEGGVEQDSFDFQGYLSNQAGTSVTIAKTGEGTQIFSGSVSDSVHFTIDGGKIVLSGSVEGSSHNVTFRSGTLEYSGSGAATFGTLTTDTTGTTPGELVVKNGSLTITTAIGYTGELTLAGGGALNLQDAGEHALSAIHVAAGESGAIGVNVIAETQLSVTNWDILGALNISLLGLTLDTVESLDVEEYKIFSNWEEIKNTLTSLKDDGKLTIDQTYFGRRTISFNWEDGTLDMTEGDPKDLTWNGDVFSDWFDASVDRDRSSSKFWTSPDADQFYNYDSVTFGENGNRVILNGDIIADNVTVHGNWTFFGQGGDDSFAIAGTLTVDDGKSLEIESVTYKGDALVVEGGGSAKLKNAVVSQSTFTVGGNVTLENVTLNAGSALVVKDGSTAALTAAAGPALASLTLEENASMSLSAAGATVDSLTMGDQATLTLGSDLSVGFWGAEMAGSVTINGDGTERTLTLTGSGNNDTADFTFGADITVRKTNSAEVKFGPSGDLKSAHTVTMLGKVVVETGKLQFNGGAVLNEVEIASGAELVFWKNSELTREIKGAISGGGTLITINQELALNGGGTLTGLISIGYAGTLSLGKDFTAGGLRLEAGALSYIQKSSAATDDVTLTLNVADGTTASVPIEIRKGVNLVKTGLGTQTFTGASVIGGDLEVAQGTLDISGITTKSIGGSLTLSGGTLNWGTANLAVGGDFSAQEDYTAGGDLTVSGAATIASGKTFTVGDGRTVSFASMGTGDGTGGAVTVAQGGALSIADAAGGSISTLSVGGTLTLSGGTLNITTLDATSTEAVIGISLTGGTKLNVSALGSSIATNPLKLSLTLVEAMAFLEDGYQLFDATHPSDAGWQDLFTVEVTGNESGLVSAELDATGKLVFTLTVANLRWTGQDGVWQENGAANWEHLNDASQLQAFANNDFVTFDNADGGTMQVTGNIIASGLTVAQGEWVFADTGAEGDSLTITSGIEVQSGSSARFTGASLTVGGTLRGEISVEAAATTLTGDLKLGTEFASAEVSFGGSGTVAVAPGASVTVSSGSSLIIGNSGSKSFGTITAEQGATVTITNATDWADSKVKGDGTVVYKNISVGVEGANTTWNDFYATLQHTLDNTGTTGNNPTVANIGSIELDHVQIFQADQNLSGNMASYFRSAKELHIKEGSSIGFNGATFNNGAGRMLYLAGSGANGEGVLYLSNNKARTVNWDVVLEADAWLHSTQGTGNMLRFELIGTYDSGGRTAEAEGGEREGYVMHIGNGVVRLYNTFKVAQNSKGTFEVHQGALTIYAAAAVTGLANYDVKLSGGDLGLMQDSTTIHALYGESDASMVTTYTASGDSDIKDTANTVRTLVINNTDTFATEKNTYAGGVSGTVKLELTGGYEKLTGILDHGAVFSVSSADAATLELAGRFDGAHTLNVGDNGTLKLADAERGTGAALEILASGSTGVIDGLTLSRGDVLGFVDAPVSGNDPAVTVTLTGTTVLESGSSLHFGVTNTGSDAAKNWTTATKLVVNGSLSVAATAGDAVNLVIDPYARMASGEMLAMEAGEKYCIIQGGVTEDMLSAFAPSLLAGRFVYDLSVENGSLYVTVIEGAGILVWNEVEGGTWSTTDAWKLATNQSLVTFRDGDAVVFDTMDTTASVVVTVDSAVAVSGITVKGSTSYVLSGNISGTPDVVDMGLTVGTDESPFSGTLTLTGENSWRGETVINSGTVVVTHASALSNTAITVKTGAELKLNISGAALAAEVGLDGGALTALTDASVSLSGMRGKGGVLQANARTTLTALASAELGSLTINADEAMTGEVALSLGGDSAAADALDVQQGSLTLTSRDADVVLYAGEVQIQAAATLTVGEGVTLAGEMNQTEGELVMQAGSELSATGTIGKLTSQGAVLDGNAYTKVSELLTLAANASLISGMWDVEQVSGGELVTGVDADVTLRAGALSSVELADGVLRVGDGLQVGHLEMVSGTLAGADAYLATVNVETLHISGNAEVSSEVTLALTGTGSEISGGAVDGKIEVNHAAADGGADLTISGGTVSGEMSIVQGRVVLAYGATVTGHVSLLGAGATLDLGGWAADMGISLVGGGTLQNAEAYTGSIVIDDAGEMPGASFDLGGLSAGVKITIVSLNGGNTVSNLDSLTLVGENTIYLNADLEVGSGAAQPLFVFNGSGALALEQGASLFVDVSSILGDVLSAGLSGLSYQVANTSLSSWDGLFTYDATAVVLGWEVQYYGNGILHFTMTGEAPERNIYQSTEQQGSSNGWANAVDGLDIYESVGSWGAIVVDKQTDIDLRGTTPTGQYAQTGLLIHNLMGTDAGTLNITGDGTSKVTFRNDVSEEELENLRDQLGGDLVRNSLTYGGDINISGADLEVNHVMGMYSSRPNVDSTTSVLGDLKLTDGNLTMTSGRLELNGAENELGKDVTFHEFQGQVSVSGKLTVGGTISVEHDDRAVGEERAHVQLKGGAQLSLAGGAAVGADVIIGSDVTESTPQVAGTVYVAENRLSGKTSISADSKLRHVVLDVEGALEVQPAEVAPFSARSVDAGWTLAGITGSGSLAMAQSAVKDIDFLVGGEDRYFYGDLADYAGTMTFRKSDLTQYFTGVNGGTGWNVTNAEGAHLVFNMAESGGNNKLTMGSLRLAEGSFTTILLDLENMTSSSGLHLQGLNIADGADVTIGQYRGTVWLEGQDGEEHTYVLGTINVVEGGEKSVGEDVQWHLKGIRNADNVKVSVDSDGRVLATVTQDNTNLYALYANNANSAAGAQMLWGNNESEQLSALDERVYELLGKDAPKTAADVAEANRILAAAAGSGVAVLSSAFSADIERQLRTMRNRTAGMVPQARTESGLSADTWLNAENNYYKQDADGMLPGFKTTGWGGTVGVNTTVGKSTVVGLSLSAMYNDVDSDGPDQLKGSMDTFYVSAFAQVTSSSWRHTFICTVGRAEMEMDRTVNYGTGSYTTHGNTDSLGLGLMYELGYSVSLSEDAATCLQTVFNVAWKTNRMGDYTESGSDAALRVKSGDYNSVTLGLGARVQAAVGANAWNRIGVLEGRALVKSELGDREGVANVAFQRAGSPEAQVKSSEKGAVGVELGAGLTLPVSGVSDVFVDFSVELWKNLVEMNAGIGYKVSF